MWVISLAFSLVLIVAIRDITAREVSAVNAVVTLVTGPSSPYASGAIALGQSLVDIGSKLRRVVMVTPDVEKKTRDTMKTLWEVIEVQPIACNHQNKLDPTKYDLAGPTYKAGIQRWSATCTKFAAFTLTQFERIIFMDSDMLVVGPIDDAIYGFSNASFLAAPETFPPDTFNSGFLVLNPSKANYENIMRHNAVTGSAEGGDQGVFNNGLCPDWHSVGSNDANCGRLPWIFNVEAVHYEGYNTLRMMSNLRLPSVIHYVSDGKPWTLLLLEYQENGVDLLDPTSLGTLALQGKAHMMWRDAFFRATGEVPSNNKMLLEVVARGTKSKSNLKSEGKNKIGRKLPKLNSARGKGSVNDKTADKLSEKRKKRKLLQKKKKGDTKSKPTRRTAMKKNAKKKIINKKGDKGKAPEL